MSTGIGESITFDPATETYRLRVDRRRDESVTAALTRGVAIVTNTPPTESRPLFETIDPDALDRLYDPGDWDSGDANSPRDSEGRESARDSGCRDSGGGDARISFRFNGCDVRVSLGGVIEITPDEDPDPTTARVPRTIRDR